MHCPLCQHPDTRVMDTRAEGRRRECERCKHRFKTMEVPKEDWKRYQRVMGAVKLAMETEE